jgi:hypothetical protein
MFVMIAVQVGLGLMAHGVPFLGALHGPVAIGIAVMAYANAREVARPGRQSGSDRTLRSVGTAR